MKWLFLPVLMLSLLRSTAEQGVWVMYNSANFKTKDVMALKVDAAGKLELLLGTGLDARSMQITRRAIGRVQNMPALSAKIRTLAQSNWGAKPGTKSDSPLEEMGKMLKAAQEGQTMSTVFVVCYSDKFTGIRPVANPELEALLKEVVAYGKSLPNEPYKAPGYLLTMDMMTSPVDVTDAACLAVIPKVGSVLTGAELAGLPKSQPALAEFGDRSNGWSQKQGDVTTSIVSVKTVKINPDGTATLSIEK